MYEHTYDVEANHPTSHAIPEHFARVRVIYTSASRHLRMETRYLHSVPRVGELLKMDDDVYLVAIVSWLPWPDEHDAVLQLDDRTEEGDDEALSRD